MKINPLILFLLSLGIGLSAQDLEVSGKAKIGIMLEDITADSVVVRQLDGTLAIRAVSSISDSSGWTMEDDTTHTLKYVGIGTTTPDQKLHVHKGSAGDVIADPSSIAVFETNTNGYLSILHPAANESGIIFGNEFDNPSGSILFNRTNLGGFTFNIGDNSEQFRIDSDGLVTAHNRITNVTDPVDTQDAATKAYVDKLLGEIDWLKGLLGIGEVTDVEGNVYPTVQIGTQFWMAKNLNIGMMIDSLSDQADNGIIEKYCYRNLESNCDVYGGLYHWDELMQYVITEGTQGICPSGWHVPTDGEWDDLRDYLDPSAAGNNNIAGGKMKEAGLSHWNSPNTAATNESSFTGLPGGFQNSLASFFGIGRLGYWWTSSQSHPDNAWVRQLKDVNDFVLQFNDNKELGFSVRCLRN